MRATRPLYRIAAVLILLFDLGHSAGYPWSDPSWGAAPEIMRSVHFRVFGFTRTYWDFYVGFGLFVSVFLLFAAVVAWQLGGLSPRDRRLVRITAWMLTFCFAVVAVLSWVHFFIIPIVFSCVIEVCLLGAVAFDSDPVSR